MNQYLYPWHDLEGNNEIGVVYARSYTDCVEKLSKHLIDKYDELDELDHSFCTTIHKSQGSEFRIVVIPVFMGSQRLMTRNLLYTAVTRAKKMVILVGRSDIPKKMVENNFNHLLS